MIPNRRNSKKGPVKKDSTKFKNKKVEIDGFKFDSKAESRRYLELKDLAQTLQISDLRLQTCFELIPSQRIDGKVYERACVYMADFDYIDYAGQRIVEDVKSPFTKTPAYVIKRKLMLERHGIRISEVYQAKETKKPKP